jgi:outer membrane protein
MKICAIALTVGLVSLTSGLISSAEEAGPLTLKRAEEIAVQNHPRITEAELNALAARQVTRQARAAFFPTIVANATAVGQPNVNERIGAGALNAPSLFPREADGVNISQILTDFGRTANLTSSARLHERAQQENALATREDILLQVDSAYYRVLGAAAVVRVAQETVNTRKLVLDQVSALASNKLRSDLDVSFAFVAYGEGKLLLTNATNDLEAAFANLATWLGVPKQQNFTLVAQPMPPPAPTNDTELVQLALQQRPELAQLRLERESAAHYAQAQKQARYPTVSAIGVAGVIPVHVEGLPDTYAGAGVNVNLPIYVGGLLVARQREAELRAKAAEQALIDQENNIIRDVRVAWLNSNNALERWRISDQILKRAQEAFELAQSRYNGGLSSIIELSQAQLNVTAAEIERASAMFDYQIQRANLDYQVGTPK